MVTCSRKRIYVGRRKLLAVEYLVVRFRVLLQNEKLNLGPISNLIELYGAGSLHQMSLRLSFTASQETTGVVDQICY